MARWIELVCDVCAKQGPGRTARRSGWAKVEAEAEQAGWTVEVTTHTATHLCPSCARRAARGTPNPGEKRAMQHTKPLPPIGQRCDCPEIHRDGWHCTRDAGHDGPHVAHTEDDGSAAAAVWYGAAPNPGETTHD